MDYNKIQEALNTELDGLLEYKRNSKNIGSKLAYRKGIKALIRIRVR